MKKEPTQKTPSPLARKLISAGLIASVLVFAFYLRFENIDARPMHSDEAVQAYRVGEMLAGKTFVYDPQDFHGPTLYYFSFWLCKLFGITNFSEMTETLVRAVPAITGALACILIPLSFFGRKTGAVFIAGILLACSQIAFFYSGYFIQETILVVFTWCAAGIWFFRKKTIANAVLAGACAGIAIASKETWALAAAAFLLGGAGIALVRRHFREPQESAKQLGKRLAAATLSAGTLAALFYSSFGQNPDGPADFFVAFKNYFFAGTNAESPHAKPFLYYANLLLKEDKPILFIAFVNCFLFLLRAVFPTRNERKFQCAFAGSDFSKPVFIFATALALFVLYSIIPYKTPWCVLGIVPAIALLPAAATQSRVFKTVFDNLYPRTIIAVLLSGALFLIPFSGEIPSLRYEHCGEDLPEIVPAIEKAKEDFVAGGRNTNDFFVALAGPEYWPLPWYLRREKFGVWENLSQVPPQAAVVVAEVEAWAEADSAGTATKKSRTIFCAGLRPGVLIEARENFELAD